MPEKSFVKHFRERRQQPGKDSGPPSRPADRAASLGGARVGNPSARLGARAWPTGFHATSVSHALCKLRLLIGQMVNRHFFVFFLKK